MFRRCCRRVQLLGAAADSTGAITLAFDDAQSAANWNVSASDDSAILRPTDTARMIERLRRASSLAVTAGTSSATFALGGMFETPIQANIDQCGNYTDPAWRPVTEAQNGTTGAGASYWLELPRLERWTAADTDNSVDASGEAAGPDEQPNTDVRFLPAHTHRPAKQSTVCRWRVHRSKPC